MRPHPGFIAALEAALDVETESDSDDESLGQPLGCEAEVAGSQHYVGNVSSRSRDVCRPLTSTPEAISVC